MLETNHQKKRMTLLNCKSYVLKMAGYIRPFFFAMALNHGFCLSYFFNSFPSLIPYGYPLANVCNIDNKSIEASPNPNKNPVINLLAFVLSYEVNCCMNPSISIGIMITIDTARHGLRSQNKTIPDSIPANSPVHLAHSGSCFPW